MELTRQEEHKNRIISGVITSAIFTLLLLFLIWFQLITPNPPFPEPSGGGGQELALGMINLGNDKIDFGSMGSVTDVVAEETPQEDETFLTDEGGENVVIPKEEKNKKKQKEKTKPVEEKKNVTVIKPVKPQEKVKEKTETENITNLYSKNMGKNGGGVGNNTQAGQNGDIDGNPDFDGTGGTGTGKDGGNSEGKGPGSNNGIGGGKGGYGFELKGRAVVKPPKLPSDTKEQGKVVLDILVDKDGTVTEATIGRGTDVSSPALIAKAKQAALATKFNASRYPEQRGTITIVFSFN
ncbi:MAG: energy transducer TonB [Bacteroidetes bacterium]|nr:energy transducer TonB [Bacteroidota bacterium]